jgi:hypothetical protein
MSAQAQQNNLKLHHTALTRGYVSRKNPEGIARPYKGKFGEGIMIFTPNFESTRYCYVSYYVA